MDNIRVAQTEEEKALLYAAFDKAEARSKKLSEKGILGENPDEWTAEDDEILRQMQQELNNGTD